MVYQININSTVIVEVKKNNAHTVENFDSHIILQTTFYQKVKCNFHVVPE